MITFISEEKENATGTDWIQADSMYEDICLFSVGKSEEAIPGISVSDFSSYACMGEELVELYDFSLKSAVGESLALGYLSESKDHQQEFSVTHLEEFFKVEITETGAIDGNPDRKTYSYDVAKEDFLEVAESMHSLYHYIKEEQSKSES